ncbi:leucine-rich repeat and fibronectin type III domain-containing protein 1-like protein [Tubulanus polymorphus]|uniref:leucine-rich repeat and fibronectin type III domain-containing protein 1-like protein n=1 Tax=Tubulanus polymorphus TaxID=672921 RepID=UPI003DA447D9
MRLRYVLILQLAFICTLHVIYACPPECFCNPIIKSVNCQNKGLKTIPKRMPKETLEMNMNKNEFEISTLRRNNFSDFRQLRQLFLSGCGIKAITVGSFIDLINLKWLDLSQNRIKDLQDFTFRGLSLDQLFISGNDGIVLHKDTFNGLKAKGLYLTHCGLKEINARLLTPLNDSLNYLWLNHNRIRSLSPHLHRVFKNMRHLRITDNPLHCNCRMKWFKRFYDSHMSKFDESPAPSCASPSHAHHRGFGTLSLEDFRCQPPTFNDVDLLFSNEKGILSCTASGDPAPTLIWVKPNGERKIFFPRYNEPAVKTDAVMRITHGEDLYTGGYECMATNDGGNVTLKLNVSWPKIEKKTIIRYVGLNESSATIDTTDIFKKGAGTIYGVKKNKQNSNEKSFTMIQLIIAVAGTFVATLLVCLLVFQIVSKIRANQVPRNRLDNSHYTTAQQCAKPIASNSAYLNNRADDDDLYMRINDLPHR